MKTIEAEATEYANQVGDGTGNIDTANAAYDAVVHGIKLAQTFIPVEEELPNFGTDVLLFNEEWKDEDYNPRGIRIGFREEDGFISAHWWNYQDCYMTISKSECEDNDTFSDKIKNSTEPTHWRPIELK